MAATYPCEITELTGYARVQHSGSPNWVECARGHRIIDNDIIETFFQTRATISFGKGNILILGSNSKVLITLAEKHFGDMFSTEVTITVFNGGIFTKALAGCHINIYTTNSFAETKNGSISAIVDEKSGETGFQTFSGDAATRNIALSESMNLTSGMTTIIKPGKEPAPPVAITTRHVSVLKHFFGDKYIQLQLDSAGVKPVSDPSARTTVNASERFAASRTSTAVGTQTYKRLFDLGKIWGAIIADEPQGEYLLYSRSSWLTPVFGNHFAGGFSSEIFTINGQTFPTVKAHASTRWSSLSGGVRASVGKSETKWDNYQGSTLTGILDMVDFFDVNWRLGGWIDTLAFHAGDIQDYSLGSGMVVEGLDNRNPGFMVRPLGLSLHVKSAFLVFDYVNAGVTTSGPVALQITAEPSVYHFSFGYAFDGNTHVNESLTSLRRTGMSTVATPPVTANSEFDVAWISSSFDLVNYYAFSGSFGIEYGQRVGWQNNGKTSRGNILRFPAFDVKWYHLSLGLSAYAEQGALVGGAFSKQYMHNRGRNVTTPTPLLVTPFYQVSTHRNAKGLDAYFYVNPLEGMSIEISARADGFVDSSFTDSTLAAYNTKQNYSWKIRCDINEKCIPFMHSFTLFAQQKDVALAPVGGKAYPSWGTEAGIDFMTKPFLLNCAISGGGSYFFLDRTNESGTFGLTNNAIDNGDALFSYRFGLYRGF